MSKIYSRASWGARYRDGVATRKVGSLQKFFHHSVTKHLSENATVAEEKAQCRVVESIGQQRFGAGISYTFLVFPSGRIYQGASVNRVSYHSGGGRDGKPRNTLGVGICLVGNTEANPMTAKQIAAVVWLLQEGVRKNWWTDPAITEGHRDFKSTSCPGKFAYAQIGNINEAARSGKAVSSGDVATPTKKEFLDMDVDAFNKEASRHAENVHKGLKEDLDEFEARLMAALPGMIDTVVRKRDNLQNTALHNMVKRELAAAIGLAPNLDADAIAERLAALLGNDVEAAIERAIEAQPDRSAAEVARAVVRDLGYVLSHVEESLEEEGNQDG